MTTNDYSNFILRDEISRYFSHKYILVIFVIFMILRLLLIFLNPLFTTDLARSLFYGKNFWSVFFDVYKLTPVQIDPSFNIIDPTTGLLAWPDNTYDYGIVSLIFYSLIGLIPADVSVLIIISKFLFNFIDILNFFLLITLYPKLRELPIIYWIILTPFSSIEGQPVSITIFMFIVCLYFYNSNKKSLAYSFIAIGFHWKYITLILLPYFIFKDIFKVYSKEKEYYGLKRESFKPMLYFLAVIFILMFPILFSPYILSYISFGGNLLVVSLPWNPFYLGLPITIAGFLLLILIIGLIIDTILLLKSNKLQKSSIIDYLPLLSIWGFLLIYKYAFPWYWLWSFPLFSSLPELRQRKVFYYFSYICIIASIEFINWTVGFSYFIK